MSSDMRKTLKVLYPDDFSRRASGRKKRKTGFLRKQFNAFRAFIDDIGRAKVLSGLLTVTTVGILAYVAYTYNQFTSLEMGIMNARANVKKEVQRRNDLITNLIPPTMKYLEYEQKMFSRLARLRTGLMGKALAESGGTELPLLPGMEQNMPSIMGVFENYPDLKASKPFTDLMQELIATENRVAGKWEAYNDTVKNYNTYITRVPARWVAILFSYDEKKWFEARTEALPVPDVLKQLTALKVKPES